MKESVKRRWESFITKSDDCWIWSGSKTTQGYGQFNVDGTKKRAHQIGWQLLGRSLSTKNHVLKNQCGNKMCVNPDHWEETLRVTTLKIKSPTSKEQQVCEPVSKKELKMEEFANKINENGPLILDTPCWQWLGAINRNGYGLFNSVYFSKAAHRASWEIFNGAIPEDVFVCHRCDNRSCVNPEHLFLGTAKDNVYDMIEKGRAYRK